MNAEQLFAQFDQILLDCLALHNSRLPDCLTDGKTSQTSLREIMGKLKPKESKIMLRVFYSNSYDGLDDWGIFASRKELRKMLADNPGYQPEDLTIIEGEEIDAAEFFQGAKRPCEK